MKYMRLLGLDVIFDPSLSLAEIISISKTQKRIILTKSKNLLKYKEVSHGILVRLGTITEQIKSIIEYLDIRDRLKPFSRCLLCNSLIVNIPKKETENRIPPKTKEFYNDYTYCIKCNKIYWKGSHYIRMKSLINEMMEE